MLSACGSAPPMPTAGSAPPVAENVPSAAKEVQPEILVTNYAAGVPTSAVVFAKGAHGNATPLRMFATKVPAFGIRSDGTYWSGPIYATTGYDDPGYLERHAANGKVIRKIAGSAYVPIREVSTDRSGDVLTSGWQRNPSGDACFLISGTLRLFSIADSFKQTRSIAAGNYCTNVIYNDLAGNVYIGYDNQNYSGSYDYASIVEVGPHAKSLDDQKREIPLAYPYDTIQGLGTDTHGNLFALENGELLKYAPGKTAPTYVLKGVPVSSFAIDSKNDLYVVVGTYIEEFAPGTNRPMRVIGGPATGLTNPAGITVAD